MTTHIWFLLKKLRRIFFDEFYSFLDGSLEFGQGCFQKFFFKIVEFSESEILLESVLSEEDRSCEESGLGHVRLDVGALDDALLAVQALDDGVGETDKGWMSFKNNI